MRLEWGKGVPKPKDVSIEEVKDAIDRLPEPSPEQLIDASQEESHCLHKYFWEEDDSVWAHRGRIERSRKLISSVYEIQVVGDGKKEIPIRAYEFVRTEDGDNWYATSSIFQNPELEEGYLREISRLMDQAAAKMEKYREIRADNT